LTASRGYAVIAIEPMPHGLKKTGTKDSKKEAVRAPSLRELARELGLSPTTVSLVLNDSAAARSIPQATKDRVIEAARKLNYRPNFIARAFRARRTYTVGVLVPELGDGYSPGVLAGVAEHLLESSYFYLVAGHGRSEDLIRKYEQLFLDRCVEGIIAVDTPQRAPPPLPMICVSGHDDVEGVTNLVLDHDQAAQLALEHLLKLGHRRIAVLQGQELSSDTDVRWRAIQATAERLNVPIQPELVARLEGDEPSPEPGYRAARTLLARRAPFTALFAFNDLSAIGAIRALREAGHRVPEDVSVVGFDDIHAAAFHHPTLTTIRQPLAEMGRMAADQLLKRISGGPEAEYPRRITVPAELIERQSTARI